MEKNAKIYVAGHTGLVGSALVSQLKQKGYNQLITRSHSELDLIDCLAVEKFFNREKPDYLILAAAQVGGIVANNTYRAKFLYENLMIQNNVIHQSYLHRVKKLMFLGSTCIYPKECPQPIKEDYLLTAPLEYTNEPYAIAKIAGMKMCESYNLQYGTNFISVMPTNLYGPNDNFDLETSHVLPALMRKIFLGKAFEDGDWLLIRKNLDKWPLEGLTGKASNFQILKLFRRHGISCKTTPDGKRKATVEIWGSGKPRREFLWSEDMADACIFIMENFDFEDVVRLNKHKEIRNTHINIGTGKDITIKEIAHLIKSKIGFRGELFFNSTKNDGTMRKVTDISKLRSLGWKHGVELEEGLVRLIKEMEPSYPAVYPKNQNEVRKITQENDLTEKLF